MIKVVSTNIRFDNPADGEHDWKGRREILTDCLQDFSPDIFGTQEGWENQLYDLLSLMNEYEICDGHRNWIQDRMYPSIFVKKGVFDIHKSGDIWLSETPDIPASKSFNSAFPRLCTWIIATHIASNKKIIFVDVHLDHLETQTRQEQIKVLIKEITTVNSESLPIILLGDFNESPTEKVRELLDNSQLNLFDPWLELGHKEEPSHHGFKGFREDGTRIDWILCDKSFEALEIFLFKESDQGIYPSDHFPVFAKIKVS